MNKPTSQDPLGPEHEEVPLRGQSPRASSAPARPYTSRLDEEVDRRFRREVETAKKRGDLRIGIKRILPQVRGKFGREQRLVGKRKFLSGGFEEKIEGLEYGQLSHEIDLNGEDLCRFREDQSSEVIALWVLLPVYEVARRLNAE